MTKQVKMTIDQEGFNSWFSKKLNEDKTMDVFSSQITFAYLDELRDSGVTNMWGATAWLIDEYDIDDNLAKDILLAWMDWVNQGRPNLETQEVAS